MGTDYKLNDFILIDENAAIQILQIFVFQKEEVITVSGLKYSVSYDVNVRMHKIVKEIGEGPFLLSSFDSPSINLLKCKQNLYLKKKCFYNKNNFDLKILT